VWAVATAVLPDGRPVAVTGGDDATVRIWDLGTGALLGSPLTGHTRAVWAVAAMVLPGGRPVAVAGSYDATVRIWDISAPGPIGYPLHVNAAVEAVALCRNERDVCTVIVGDGVTRVDVGVELL
jgi:WD40 repeat protein